MRILSVKNFEQYQHYKDRMPPWIKLYRSIYNDREFMRLTIESRYLYIGLLVLFSECNNRLAEDLDYIAHRLAMPVNKINLEPLMLREENGEQRGFLLVEGEPVPVRQESKQKPVRTAVPSLEGFDEFWATCPKKVGKGAAEKAWEKIRPDGALREKIVHAMKGAAASEDWTRDGGRYIPHPATWLNQKRWEDEGMSRPVPQPRKVQL
jgi:hypothetical protein